MVDRSCLRKAQNMTDTFNTSPLDLFLAAHESDPSWSRLYPRHYHTPEGYLPAKYLSGILGVAINLAPMVSKASRDKGMYTEEANSAVANLVAQKVVDTGVQQFWLGRAVGEALLRTTVPKDAILRETPWPFPAFVIYLPKGLLSTEKSGDVCHIAVSLHTPGDHDRYTGGTIEEDRLLIHAGSVLDDGRVADWYATYPTHCAVAEIFDPTHFRHSEICPDIRAVSDSEVATKIIELVLNTCYYMAQAAEAVDEHIIGGKRKRGKEVTPWWTPRWVGHRYAGAQRDRGGSHLSPRMHWRRGHFRAQGYGEGRKQIRQTWIEPVIVNSADTPEE
jgi:hypothetical protein